MTMTEPDLDEDATIFIGEDEMPVYEGRLRDALQYTGQTMREADRAQCYILTLSGDRYRADEIDALGASLSPTSPAPSSR